MGELEGRKSAWAYVEGGMGKLSQTIADSATSMGATILTNKVENQLFVVMDITKYDRPHHFIIFYRTDLMIYIF